MKVLFVDKALSFGGSIEVASRISMILSEQEAEFTLATDCQESDLHQIKGRFKDIVSLNFRINFANEQKYIQRLKSKNVLLKKLTTYSISAYCILMNFWSYYLLLKLIWKSDVVHSNNSIAALILAKSLQKRTIWHAHGPIEESSIYRKMIARSDCIISISKFVTQNLLSNDIPESKIMGIPNPLSQTTIIQKTNSIRDIDVLSVGRLVGWKGQLQLVKALAVLKSQGLHLNATIAGDADESSQYYKSEILSYIKENQLETNVTLLGHIANPENYYERAKLFVHTSVRPEPFGLVITEAAQFGCAVICSSLGAGPEIINDNQTGLIVNPQDIETLAHSIKKIIESPEYSNRLKENLRIDINKRFGNAVLKKLYLDAYAG